MIAFEKAEILKMGVSFETEEEMTLFLDVLTEELQRRIEGEGAYLTESGEIPVFQEDPDDDEMLDYLEEQIENAREICSRCKAELRGEILRYREQIAGHSPDYPDELLHIKIEELDLSVRSFNCLKRAGINSLGDILAHGELSDIRNLGRKGITEITQMLREMGL